MGKKAELLQPVQKVLNQDASNHPINRHYPRHPPKPLQYQLLSKIQAFDQNLDATSLG